MPVKSEEDPVACVSHSAEDDRQAVLSDTSCVLAVGYRWRWKAEGSHWVYCDRPPMYRAEERVIEPVYTTPTPDLEKRVAELEAALRKAKDGLEAGIYQSASRTFSGEEVPVDEQYPWVRQMQIGRDAARAALQLKPRDEAKGEG